MKEFITMRKIDNSLYYQGLEVGDYRFVAIWALFSPFMRPEELIDWFCDENKTSRTNEYVSIRKESGLIALYDISEQVFGDEPYASINQMLEVAQRFEMSLKNFAEIIDQWEELRVSRPDIILVVIHEDNHVSLETDPIIIKEYQDAGYAFDIDKQ